MIQLISTDHYFINGFRALLDDIPARIMQNMPCNGRMCIVDVSHPGALDHLAKNNYCHFIYVVKNDKVHGIIPSLQSPSHDYTIINRKAPYRHIKERLLRTLTAIMRKECFMTGVSMSHRNKATSRELQIIEYVETGLSTKEIKDILKIDCKSVYAHRRSFMLKANAHSIGRLFFALSEVRTIASIMELQTKIEPSRNDETYYCRRIVPVVSDKKVIPLNSALQPGQKACCSAKG
ncbi:MULTISPECIES: LuxR C-terminal-related transcriptional regulator [Buttiauxella]|jgi:DNA-binding CsgD family transcriptional regulator|uniref:Signal transduction response regulator n=1 Tax=Buttiauxella ferragutiae ATCC 51602 TaxID=1354252 RepID=A0ABX2WBE3_9ENTR|nr:MULTISPECIES: LuxR C-terminal-related transcriptional regulator [Buttiauxella]AYN28359.1 hypothetical protein D8682_16075 [Buttiauxella sp. 3AFRM03]MCE0827470.1 LuxR C-terminal-related transcriptional regulator [Buttiauxella ferragutiae]OAT30242.1 signal transduction response regulator [Buttiauxella ferragutiae ATCC 51602]TDN52864.1 DNA-binding CsgD family transcriptional regulator [Buttiauxella sp. JUb87]UNK61495.1 LuxR C-terminal-related transcriptional regulator [Buttiauxella ferragutiae